jgi:hypothetical protein
LSNGNTVHKAAAAARVIDVAAKQLGEVRADADLNETLGVMAGATILEALALEIVLKARLLRAGVKPPKWHSHSDLFAARRRTARRGSELSGQSSCLHARDLDRGPRLQRQRFREMAPSQRAPNGRELGRNAAGVQCVGRPSIGGCPSYFPAQNCLFRSRAREAAKAKPAKLGLAGLRAISTDG